jgi:flagellin
MGDISLTASMRANLLALQSTVNLMGRTQERLASGKKVNSALDNPTNYFTAKSHTQRSSDLLGFKDSIGEAIQTIKSADTAITGITALISSAKALAEDAKGALGSAAYSQTLTINTLSGFSAGGTIGIGGTTFTAVSSAGSAVGTNFLVTAASTSDTVAAELAAAINRTTEATTSVGASVANNMLTISPASAGATMLTGSIDIAGALLTNFTESSIGSGTELANKVSKYATMISQLNDLQNDAFYKGKNLLSSGDDMTVRFGNNHALVVNAFNSTSSGLSLSSTATGSWASATNIQTDIDLLTNALDTLRTNSSNLSSNLSIVQTRSDWISSVANILQIGADQLVNADTNEEGASMLMLQTRQSLSTSALSMAAQSAQSVLKLFQ